MTQIRYVINPFTKKLDAIGTTSVAPGTVVSLEGDVGGPVGPNGSGTIFTLSAAGPVTNPFIITGTPVSNTLRISAPGAGWTWEIETTNFTPQAGYAYFVNSGGTVNVTLPVTANFGDTFKLYGFGGTYSIKQNAGDDVVFGVDVTTAGTGGSITSTEEGDTITYVCAVDGPPNVWTAIDPIGNFTVV